MQVKGSSNIKTWFCAPAAGTNETRAAEHHEFLHTNNV